MHTDRNTQRILTILVELVEWFVVSFWLLQTVVGQQAIVATMAWLAGLCPALGSFAGGYWSARGLDAIFAGLLSRGFSAARY